MSMRRFWLASVVTAVAYASGCASTPIKKADVPALANADALVLQGCYDCLLDARTIYARVGVGKARPLVVARLFETDVLIFLRERELALDTTSSFTQAQSLAKELPPAMSGARLLDLIDAVPGDDLGWTHRETNAWRREHVNFVPKIDAELQWLETATFSAPVRDYVRLAVDCAYPNRLRPNGSARFTRPAVAPDAPPLIAYRTGICVTASSEILNKVRDTVPRFVETGYFLSRPALVTAKQDGGRNIREWLNGAYTRFPQSPSVTYLSGSYNQVVGDCKAALKFYDETLAIRPEHENGLLGRTICLTYLKRNDEAIAEATHMIALRTDNIDQAYYWRSWNRYQRQELDLARADIESAKLTHVSSPIYTLAGMIEHDQTDLLPAESDLNSALMMDSQNCTAMWYLGLVALKKEQWLISGGQFHRAMTCYETAAQQDEQGLQQMQARTNLEPDFKAAQIAGFEAALAEDRSQQYAAAFNAANQYAHGGDVAKAKSLLEIAARDPALSKQVAELRKILGGHTKLQ